MEINCIICSDLFTQSSQMVVNQCGHMFHQTCLLQWLERSKTCPQCRSRATEKSVYKAYFNFLNTDHIKDDVGTLQAKLDGANFKVKLKEQELKELYKQYDLREAQNVQLRDLVGELESRIRSLESGVNGLKEQISFYRTKAKETEKLQAELITLKTELKNTEKVQIAINGTRAEVNEILKNETNIDALAIISATLKKSLIDVDHKNSILQSRMKHAKNDITRYKRECSILESTNLELRRHLEDGKKSWEEEKQYLRNKIEEMNKRLKQTKSLTPDRLNSSVQRILTESPAPLPRRKEELNKNSPPSKSSPTVAESVINIRASDSPYLPVRSSYPAVFASKYSSKLNPSKSIFKVPHQSVPPPNASTSNTIYDGLGGQVKEDLYKFPEKKPQKVGLKRPKSSVSVSSTKFRKLAPLASNKKITDYSE